LAEEQYPIFKSEGESFDRAKINSEIQSGNVGVVTSEVGDAMKAAGKVSQEAKKFFDQIFNDELKALDPAYDPKDISYQYAYSSANSHKKDIEKSIEKGEAVDGKEIVPIAKGDAKNKAGNAAVLKTGTVTQIAENIGTSKIKGFESFSDVSDEFDSKVKNEKASFETLMKEFSSSLRYLNEPNAAGTKLFTPEINAVISALAKVLKTEGFNSESINKMAERYDENIGKLIEKVNGGKIESAGKEVKTEDKKTEAAGVTGGEQKVAEKTEASNTGGTAAPQPAETPKTESGVTGSAIEGNKGSSGTTDSASGAGSASSTGSQTTLSEQESKEKPVEGNKEAEPEMIKGSQSGADFLKSLFGISDTKSGKESSTGSAESKTENKTEGNKEEESKKEENKEASTESQKINTPTSVADKVEGNINKAGSTNIASVAGNLSKGSAAVSSVEKIQNKISPLVETSAKPGGIKETIAQKLSSTVTPSGTTDNKQSGNTETKSSGENANTGKSKESTTENLGTGTKEGESKKESSSESAENKGGSNEELASKMDVMVSLLSQLNDTLSSPLLVTSTSKRVE